LASDWPLRRFGEICEHSAFGPRFSGRLYSPHGNIATLRTTDITEDGRIHYETMPLATLNQSSFAQHLLQVDDLVVTRSGRVGTFAVFGHCPLPVLPGAFLIRFRLQRSLADPEFYRYYFASPAGKQQVISVATGSVQQNLNITALHRLEVPVPPLWEQQAIAAMLSTLDDKIDLNNRMNATLDAMARAIFKSWFVDFDPVRTKVADTRSGLPTNVFDLFPSAFARSELGDIPQGWRVARLSELCSTQYGYTASATDEPVGPKLLRVTDINKHNWIQWSDVPYCKINEAVKNVYALKRGDIVVARMADPGKAAIIDDEIDAVFASYLVRLQAQSLETSLYVYGFLKSSLYQEYAAGARSGSVQANMNARVIVGASLVVPSESLCREYCRAVSPLRQKIAANLRDSHTLGSLRDTLLPKLLSGEIRLKRAEGSVEAAL
jgi:type I restriction enzyme S subunit